MWCTFLTSKSPFWVFWNLMPKRSSSWIISKQFCAYL